MEELVEVHQDVKELENHLRKAINIGTFMIEKHHELFQDYLDLQNELDEAELERFTVKEQNLINSGDLTLLSLAAYEYRMTCPALRGPTAPKKRDQLLQVTEFLLKSNADVAKSKVSGMPLLIFLAKNSMFDMLDIYLKHFATLDETFNNDVINMQSPDAGETMLFHVVAKGQVDLAEQLITKFGADPTIQDTSHCLSPLFAVFMFMHNGRFQELNEVESVLERSRFIDDAGFRIIELLLENGVDPNTNLDNYVTPVIRWPLLHLAVQQSCELKPDHFPRMTSELVPLILKYKPDINVPRTRTRDMGSPLQFALNYLTNLTPGGSEMSEEEYGPQVKKVVLAILDANPDIEYTDQFGGRALDHVMKHRPTPLRIEIAKLLLERGAKPTYRHPHKDQRALDLAEKNNWPDEILNQMYAAVSWEMGMGSGHGEVGKKRNFDKKFLFQLSF